MLLIVISLLVLFTSQSDFFELKYRKHAVLQNSQCHSILDDDASHSHMNVLFKTFRASLLSRCYFFFSCCFTKKRRKLLHSTIAMMMMMYWKLIDKRNDRHAIQKLECLKTSLSICLKI